ncbi:hypothetical protein Tco_0521622, partial [Tanacetum coccineum]
YDVEIMVVTGCTLGVRVLVGLKVVIETSFVGSSLTLSNSGFSVSSSIATCSLSV